MCSFHDNEVTVFEHHAGAVDTGDSDVIAVCRLLNVLMMSAKRKWHRKM